MTKLNFRRVAPAVVAVTLLSAWSGSAQMPGGINAALLKLFEKNNVFAAKAEAQVLDSSKAEVANVPMEFSMLGSKVRLEIDMTQARRKDTNPGMADALKRMGLSHVIALIRPDQKTTFVIYPDQKMLLRKAFSAQEAAAADKPYTIERTALGKETCEGHDCVKNKVVITDAENHKLEVTTWDAKDLRNFPVLIQTVDRANSSFIRFKQVNFTNPAAEQFDAPTGYVEYQDEMQMMQELSKKLGGPEKK